MLTSFSPEIINSVPSELSSLSRWLLWTAEESTPGKKPRKMPRYARTMAMRNGKLGSAEDISNLVTLQEALQAQKNNPQAGIGFAFVAGDGLVGIDLDNCVNAETGELSGRAQKIMGFAKSYTEWSPSGNGIHIIAKGETHSGKCSLIEVYPCDRFFCFTGKHLEETPKELSSPGEAFFVNIHKSIDAVKAKEQAERAEKFQAKTSQNVQSGDFSNDMKTEWDITILALNHLPASIGNDEWVQVGMAIKDKFGDSGFQLWDDWSKSSPDKYPGQREMDTRWKSFRRDGVKIGTVIAMAKAYGFIPPKQQRQVRFAEIQKPKDQEKEDPKNEVAPTETRAVPQQSEADPMDIFGVFTPPEMKYEYLPEQIIDYVVDNSELIGTDMSVIALGILVSAAACIDDGIKIQPKRHDKSWKESARIWAAVVGDPSTRKSPGFSRALSQIKRNSIRMAEENAIRTAQYKSELDKWKSIKKGEERGPEPKEPPQERLYVEDTTVEALSNILKDNPRGVMCFNDELSGWFASMDAYKGSASGASKDKSHWLEAYNGGCRQIDRVTRGSILIPNWSVCVLGGIQPDAMRKISANLTNDGLLQRFIVVCPPKAKNDQDREQHRPTLDAFQELFSRLIRLAPDDNSVVQLSEEAHECRDRIRAKADSMMDAFDSPHIKAWLGKWTGLYARLLLLYHVMESVERGIHPTERHVTGETANKVERFMCEYLLHHAIHFYHEIMEVSDRTEHMRQIARIILSRGISRVSKRDLMRYWKAFRKIDVYEVRIAMDSLQSAGWITADMNDIDVDGKPKSWNVNPRTHEIFKDHAENERKRKAQARDILASIMTK